MEAPEVFWVPCASWQQLGHKLEPTHPVLSYLLAYLVANRFWVFCFIFVFWGFLVLGVFFFFFNHFAPSFCNILQQTKHPLLGMFSICFMLILIKEFETEQTLPSRWPYKCEISKLFYLPQTLLVNFFKLIPASESLLIPRRELSNPSLQIFAFGTAPGDRTGGVCLCSTPGPGRLFAQIHPWYPIDITHLVRMRLTCSRHCAPKPM